MPLEVRLIGSFPCDETTDTRCRPELVTRNEVTLFDPALTTNSSFPFAVRLIEPDESTIGKPNGGWLVIPLPPVGTPRGLRQLAVGRALVTPITALPLGLFVAVNTQPALPFVLVPDLEAASAAHGMSNAAATSATPSSRRALHGISSHIALH